MTNNMINLRKFVAPEFIYGPGARLLAGNFILKLGVSKVMIVSDPGVKQAGWVDQILGSLKQENIKFTCFDEVSPNPRDYQVMQGAEVFLRENCEAIVAVGGGSPMDLAKGVGVVASNQKHVLEFEGIDRVDTPSPPLICIPTTAGSSADVSQFAIINDTDRMVKIAIVSKAVVPDMALIDPETTLTMDRELTAATAMDALTHAVEAYVSRAAFSITDSHALQAIRMINENLLHAVDNPEQIDYRDRLMLASLHAGLAFSNAILGAVHAMAHSLGGLMDFPHGLCNALLLSHVISFNFDAAPDKYTRIARVLGIETQGMHPDQVREELSRHIFDLHYRAGLTEPFGALGLQENSIPELASKALNDPCMTTNPKDMSISDVQEIFRKSL